MNFELTTSIRKLLADTLTPVNIYLKLRDVYAGSVLLESSDYHGHENSLSFIGCDPIASFTVTDQSLVLNFPNGDEVVKQISNGEVLNELENFKIRSLIKRAYPNTPTQVCSATYRTIAFVFLKR